MEDKNGKKIPPIELKKISGVHNLEPATINAILSASAYWIENFYNEAAGNKKVRCDFAVEGLNYGGIFDLSTAQDIIDGIAPTIGRVPYLFLSDLLSFIEQIRTSLVSNRKISLNRDQLDELDRLGNTFGWIGIYPSNNRIEIEDLQKIENEYLSETIVKRVKLIHLILAPSIGAETIEPKKTEEQEQGSGEEAQSDETTPLIPIPMRGGGGGNETDMGGAEEAQTTNDPPQQQPDESQRRRPDDPNQPPPPSNQPFKLAELDPQAKLYLQSLSIITINQALSRYFNDASLAQMGFAPGTRVTFDQLPLKVRQELMDRAFLQVETLMLGGQFTLQDLIKNPSARINFANQSALNLLIDVHGLSLLNQAVSQLVKDKENNQSTFEKELKKNEQEKLTDKQLGKRVKNQINATSTSQAEATVTNVYSNADLANLIEKQFNTGYSEKQLDDILWQELESIIGTRDAGNKDRIINNARSLIEVFIQQGLPPEYLISDPKNFGYNNFIRLFGNDLNGKHYQQHKERLANLIIFYWKRKRAIWAREIRQEFSQEKYTPEQALKLARNGDNNRANKQIELRNRNYIHGGHQVAEVLADPNSEAVKNNPELANFLKQQQDLIGKQLEAELAKRKPEEQQTVLKTYFEFYMPGYVTAEYSIEVFSQEIVPQISPMDYYMIMANQAMGERVFAPQASRYLDPAFANQGDGLFQQALAQVPGGMEGDDLANNRLTREALKWGIRAAAGAASAGASEAAFASWEAAKAADATGTLQWLESELLSKIIEFLKKNWPWILGLLILATLGPLLAALAAALGIGYALTKAFGGFGRVGPGIYRGVGEAGGAEGLGIAGKEGFNQLAPGAAEAALPVQAVPPAQSLISSIASPAMVVAGQAVVATAGASLFFMYMYQANLNSAFLVDFPFSETDLTGSAQIESRYAEVKKTAKIIKGCILTENNGTKCNSPVFPVSIEYTVTIAPKEDFSIQIIDIKDEISFKQSKKGWEEAGQSPPNIPEKKDLDFDYFKNLIAEQGNIGGPPLSTTPTPLPGEGSPTTTPSGTVINDGEIVIPAGSSLSFTYTIDSLGSNYNHTAIQNRIEVNFYYQNSFTSGTDKATAGARVCLGECSGEAGCWPTTGKLWQLPFGKDSQSSTHRPPSAGGWGDSYDIGCVGCSPAALFGPQVFARFDGELCFIRCDDNQYGCRYILTFESDGKTYYEDYAHFQEPNPQLSSPGSCMAVQAGFPIQEMGQRGIGGMHLHFGAVINANPGNWWASKPAFSITEQMVPETDEGNYPPPIGDHVTTCYQ